MATSVHSTRRVGAFSTTRSTIVLMFENNKPFDSWERTSKGEKTLPRIASSVNACLNPRKKVRETVPFIPSGRFIRRDLNAERIEALASMNCVKVARR